jgi:hypothetical protein
LWQSEDGTFFPFLVNGTLTITADSGIPCTITSLTVAGRPALNEFVRERERLGEGTTFIPPRGVVRVGVNAFYGTPGETDHARLITVTATFTDDRGNQIAAATELQVN